MGILRLFRRQKEVTGQEFRVFDPNGRLTPKTEVPFHKIREKSSVNPIDHLVYVGGDDPPYCNKAEDRWKSISEDPELFNKCQTYENVPIVIRDFHSGKQMVCSPGTRVVLKKNVPLFQSEKTGLAKINGSLYIVSPIFLDQNKKPFAIAARPASFRPNIQEFYDRIL